MELYKELANKCKIEERSRVYIPDEALKFFVRLIIANHCKDKKESFIELGYTSGLLNGTGDVLMESLKDYYMEISKKVIEIEQNKGRFYIESDLGVKFEFQRKNVPNNKCRM